MGFQKATKFASKLRMAIAGPAGAGKTWTALTLAATLAGDGGVAVIDTEHGSASKYADIFDFDTLEMDNFHPQKYIDAIREAESAGYAVLVIDSLSHAWSGTGGLLEEKEKIAKAKYKGNSFSAWNDATQLQNKLVNTILGSKLHVICTVRSKMEYLQNYDNKTNRTTVQKVGLAPVQRDDLPYEFDVFGTMEIDNTLVIDKSRCPQLSGAVIPKPDSHVADLLLEWLCGVPVPTREAQPVMHAVESLLESLDAVPTSSQLRTRCADLQMKTRSGGQATLDHVKRAVLKKEVSDDDLTPDDCLKIARYLDVQESKQQSA